MADFSKQWCDEFDPGGMPWDVDVYEVLNGLENGMYHSYICEGYGFAAIGKDENGEGILFMPNETDFSIGTWVPVDKVINREDDHYANF